MEHPAAPAQPSFVWICPTCARRVPNRLDACRCGYQRGPDDIGAADTADAPAIPIAHADSKGNSTLSWLVLGAVAVIAAGTLIGIQVMPVARQPQAAGSTLPPISPGLPVAPPVSSDLPSQMTDPGPFQFDSAPPPIAVPASDSVTASSVASLEDVVSVSVPAIVSIETREGRGSGFFAAPRTVLTNRHVVGSNASVTVRLSSGQTLPGRVDTTSSDFDLAVVKVDSAPPSQPVLPLGTVAGVRSGQEVIAIGLALGVFQNTVTRGIVSGVRQSNRVTVLQTDAAINPGNSGGPLLNRTGQVIGINTMKVTGAAESLGFAIAIDHARGLLTGGRPSDSPVGNSAMTSQPLAPAFNRPSATDEMRDNGVDIYEKTVAVVAKRAAQLDDYWTRIKRNCSVRSSGGYDREWFGLWDGRVGLSTPDASCASAVNDLNELASDVRTVMTQAQENARRSSVLPGQMRDVRRKYRMDWTGWD